MSLIYSLKKNKQGVTHVIGDYLGEMRPFARRVKNPLLVAPMVLLKTIEWSIYRWYKTPIRRFYGVKGNELIYMITNACNDRCPKCGIWERPESRDQHLMITHFIKCLNRLHHNLYQVTLTGGEPLLFKKDVLLIAEEAKKLDVPMVIVTNARFLDEEFLTRYKELGHILVISVDSVEREKWNEFRGKKNFDIVMPKIMLAKQILGDQLRIQSVLSKESAEEIPKVIEWCKQQGIQHNTQFNQDFGGHWNNHETTEKVNYDNDTPCAARKNICVYPNGDVVKCYDHRRIPLAKQPLGNIGKQDIIEILSTKRSTEISKIMKTCNFPCKNMSCNKPQTLLFN
jgi:radical SAM protein with 4Fe4S-binding SPASM domain